MKKLSSFAVCMLTLFTLQAQPDSMTIGSHRASMANVRTVGNKTITGWLYEVNDSQVVLAKSLKDLSEPFVSESRQKIIAVEQIKQVTLQKRNTAIKGALIGMLSGALTGMIIGFASGDDPVSPPPAPGTDPWGFNTLFTNVNNSFAMKAEEKAFLGAAGLGGTGFITGLIIGALAKKKFIIGGKKEIYRDLQGELMMRLVQK